MAKRTVASNLLLEDDEKGNCYIEVKSVTLLDEREDPGIGYFPMRSPPVVPSICAS